MTFLRVFITMLLSPVLFAQSEYTVNEWFQIENSEVNIWGTSNVTDYQCILHDLSNNSDLQIQSTSEDLNINLQNAILTLNCDGFNCNSSPMTRDFLKAIKATTHPYIFIEFLSFQLHDEIKGNPIQENTSAKIAVTLAGFRRVYALKLDSLKFAQSSVTVEGQKEIKMSDFNIEPPTAMFGLVKASDMVTIDFTIVFNLK